MGSVHDHGATRVRVRRLPDRRRLFLAKPRYEVEWNAPGSSESGWRCETDDPHPLLARYWGDADAHAVLQAADGAWDARAGGVGAWETLLPAGRDAAEREAGLPSREPPAYASLIPIVELLVAHGNSLADGGFLNSPGGWYCRMTNPLDIDLVQRELALPLTVGFSRENDAFGDRLSWASIMGPGAPTNQSST